MSKSTRITLRFVVVLALVVSVSGVARAQSKTPDFSGAWGPYRGGRGADPKKI
jgi:hypothetical protein